jgi:hypothetical protein
VGVIDSPTSLGEIRFGFAWEFGQDQGGRCGWPTCGELFSRYSTRFSFIHVSCYMENLLVVSFSRVPGRWTSSVYVQSRYRAVMRTELVKGNKILHARSSIRLSRVRERGKSHALASRRRRSSKPRSRPCSACSAALCINHVYRILHTGGRHHRRQGYQINPVYRFSDSCTCAHDWYHCMTEILQDDTRASPTTIVFVLKKTTMVQLWRSLA